MTKDSVGDSPVCKLRKLGFTRPAPFVYAVRMSAMAVVSLEGVGLVWSAANRSPTTCVEVAYVPWLVREKPVKYAGQ